MNLGRTGLLILNSYRHEQFQRQDNIIQQLKTPFTVTGTQKPEWNRQGDTQSNAHEGKTSPRQMKVFCED